MYSRSTAETTMNPIGQNIPLSTFRRYTTNTEFESSGGDSDTATSAVFQRAAGRGRRTRGQDQRPASCRVNKNQPGGVLPSIRPWELAAKYLAVKIKVYTSIYRILLCDPYMGFRHD